MDDVPDQESAPIPQTKFEFDFAYPTNLGALAETMNWRLQVPPSPAEGRACHLALGKLLDIQITRAVCANVYKAGCRRK